MLIVLAAILTAACQPEPRLDLLEKYVASLIAARGNEYVFDEQGNPLGISLEQAASEDLFYEVLKDTSPNGDAAIAYLLFLYTGEHFGEALVCEAANRGARIAPLIERNQSALPSIGLEPIPDSVLGSGVLATFALEMISSGDTC